MCHTSSIDSNSSSTFSPLAKFQALNNTKEPADRNDRGRGCKIIYHLGVIYTFREHPQKAKAFSKAHRWAARNVSIDIIVIIIFLSRPGNHTHSHEDTPAAWLALTKATAAPQKSGANRHDSDSGDRKQGEVKNCFIKRHATKYWFHQIAWERICSGTRRQEAFWGMREHHNNIISIIYWICRRSARNNISASLFVFIK